jgi:type I restriction enzyme S subunit
MTGLPFARAGNINSGFHFHDADLLDSSNVVKAGNKISRVGDVVFTSKGTVGRFALVRPGTPQFVYSPQLCYWRVTDERVLDSRYLFAWMHSREFLRQVHQVKGLTDMADYVSLSDQRRMKITVPPLETQRKIAAILSSYDDLIENNTRRIAILEEMARNVYREWFVNYRFPGHEDVQMVDSSMGLIPAGWSIRTLGEIARENRNGVNPAHVAPNTPYVGLEHLPRRSLALGDWGNASDVQSTKLRFEPGDILFGKIRPYFHKVSVAPVAGVCSSDTIVIKAKDPIWYALVLACVSSDDFISHAVQTSNGTKMPRANWDVLLKYPVLIPDPKVLASFTALIESSVSQIQNFVLRNRNLRRTRDLLLPKLISGEVDVSDLHVAGVSDSPTLS